MIGNDIESTTPVVSLGSINADFAMRIDSWPAGGAVRIGSDFVRLSGGKAANVAFLARKLGLETRLIAHTGDDDLAAQAMSSLRHAGIDLAHVHPIPGSATGVAMIAVLPGGDKTILLAPNANMAWTEHDATETARVIGEQPRNAVLVVDCEIPLAVVERAAEAARSRRMTVIVDPSPAERMSDRLLATAPVVVPNAAEAAILTGIECDSPVAALRAGRKLLRRGASAACIKLASGGCVVAASDIGAYIPAIDMTVVDTTGAGDAFAGALAVALAEHRALNEAVRFAVAASHLAITAYGSQPAYPTRFEIETLLPRFAVHDVPTAH